MHPVPSNPFGCPTRLEPLTRDLDSDAPRSRGQYLGQELGDVQAQVAVLDFKLPQVVPRMSGYFGHREPEECLSVRGHLASLCS